MRFPKPNDHLILIVISAAILLALFPVSNVDIWWQLKTGEVIVSERSLPRHDIFTHSVAPETRWHNTQWLFQVLIALLFRFGGWNALVLFQGLLFAGVGIGVWFWLKARNTPPLARFLAITLTLVALRYRTAMRPELVSFIFLILELKWFDEYTRTGKLRFVLLLFTQWIWSNMHSSCLLGVFLGGAAFMVRYIQTAYPQGKKKKKKETKLVPYKYWIFFGAFFLIGLINVNGIYQFTYGLTEGGKTYISELKPLSPEFFAGAAGLMVLLMILGAKRLVQRENIFLLVVFCVFSLQSLRMVRFTAYTLLVWAPVSAVGIDLLWKGILPKYSLVKKRIILAIFFILLGISLVGSLYFQRYKSFGLGKNDSSYPVEAANFIIKENLRGVLFNPFSYGGYLLWRFYPERKIFLDGRTKINDTALEKMAQCRTEQDWQRLFSDYGFTYAIIPYNLQAPKPGDITLGEILWSWKDWRLVFWDDNAMVFVQNRPEYASVIEKYEYQLIMPEYLPYDKNLRSNLALVHRLKNDSHLWRRAGQELSQSFKASPRHFRAAMGSGFWCRIENDPRAVEMYRAATSIFSRHPEALLGLGISLIQRGSYEEGISAMMDSVRYSTSKPDALYNVALAQYKAGRFKDCRKTLGKVLRRDPDYQAALNLLKKTRMKREPN